MKRLSTLLGLVALCCWCCGQSPAAAQGRSALATNGAGWLDLQPKADLAGWTRVPIPPTNTLGRQQWHVPRPGLLACDGDGGHDMLRYAKLLTNGIFHVEFRFTPVKDEHPKYNSGVFIRNSADGTVWHQAQLAMKGGFLFGDSPVQGTVRRFKTSPTEQRTKPPGQWNTLELTAQGKVLSVWLNGAQTCVYEHCEVPAGYIALEGEGYRIEFRHLKYKPLN